MVLYAPLAVFVIKVVSHSKDAISMDHSAVAQRVCLPGHSARCRHRHPFRSPQNRQPWYDMKFRKCISPFSLFWLALQASSSSSLSQGKQVVHQIVSAVRVASPLTVYFGVIFFVTQLQNVLNSQRQRDSKQNVQQMSLEQKIGKATTTVAESNLLRKEHQGMMEQNQKRNPLESDS